MKLIKKIFNVSIAFLLTISLCACNLSEQDLENIGQILELLASEDNTSTSLTIESPSTIDSNMESVSSAEETSVSITVDSSSTVSVDEPEEAEVEVKTYRFKSKKLLNEHYEKHGIEMGFETKEDYVAAANRVINNPDSLHKLEKEDNDDIFYLEETNEFVVVSTEGYIRTYFCPDSGIKYYNKQ